MSPSAARTVWPVRADGSVVGWGDNSFGQIGIPPGVTSIVAIAAGQHHSVALRSDGQVLAWGRGDNFQQTTCLRTPT